MSAIIITIQDAIAQVDVHGRDVLWVAPDATQVQRLAHWIKDHHIPALARRTPVPDARARFGRGQESYRNGNARLAIVSATAPGHIRGRTSDLVVIPGGELSYLPTATQEAIRPILHTAELAGW